MNWIVVICDWINVYTINYCGHDCKRIEFVMSCHVEGMEKNYKSFPLAFNTLHGVTLIFYTDEIAATGLFLHNFNIMIILELTYITIHMIITVILTTNYRSFICPYIFQIMKQSSTDGSSSRSSHYMWYS